MNDIQMQFDKMKQLSLTVLIEAEDGQFSAHTPQLDIASQGQTVEEARNNLREAIELFLESASDNEIAERFHPDIYISQLQVSYG